MDKVKKHPALVGSAARLGIEVIAGRLSGRLIPSSAVGHLLRTSEDLILALDAAGLVLHAKGGKGKR